MTLLKRLQATGTPRPPLDLGWFDRLISEHPVRDELGPEPPEPPKLQRKARKPNLVTVAKQVNKAAIPVARYEVRPDGTVIVHTGALDSDTKAGNELDEWLAKHAH
jgi:hypothetical protein